MENIEEKLFDLVVRELDPKLLQIHILPPYATFCELAPLVMFWHTRKQEEHNVMVHVSKLGRIGQKMSSFAGENILFNAFKGNKKLKQVFGKAILATIRRAFADKANNWLEIWDWTYSRCLLRVESLEELYVMLDLA